MDTKAIEYMQADAKFLESRMRIAMAYQKHQQAECDLITQTEVVRDAFDKLHHAIDKLQESLQVREIKDA